MEHYTHTDENGTSISIQTYPSSNQIRISVLPKDFEGTGHRTGAVYFMPWTEQLQFSGKLQDAKDEAEQNDEAAEGLAFLRAMTGAEPEYVSRSQAMEYFQRAEAYFQKHRFPEDPS